MTWKRCPCCGKPHNPADHEPEWHFICWCGVKLVFDRDGQLWAEEG
jgi:hypothetical protein